MLNRIHNSTNPNQGNYKKVLCVCSAGLLRSPTAAVVLAAEPYNFNTRAVGISQEYALTPLEAVHLFWADEIVVMQEEHHEIVVSALKQVDLDKPVKLLRIEDSYPYRDPKLMEMIATRYNEAS